MVYLLHFAFFFVHALVLYELVQWPQEEHDRAASRHERLVGGDAKKKHRKPTIAVQFDFDLMRLEPTIYIVVA